MQVEAALVREQGVTFAVVVVKSHVLSSNRSCRETANGLQPAFPGVPIVLMAQDGRGRPTYWGRTDIVHFLAKVPVQALPWRRWSVS
jgi:hypothetical protein